MIDNDPQATLTEIPRSTVTPSIIDSVAIHVEAFIGGSNVKISQLNNWRVGSEVTLETGLCDLVELRVNGMCVACGELVAVGDQFGVRITSVSI